MDMPANSQPCDDLTKSRKALRRQHRQYDKILEKAKLTFPGLSAQLDYKRLLRGPLGIEHGSAIAKLVSAVQISTPFEVGLSILKNYPPSGGLFAIESAAYSMKLLMIDLTLYNRERAALRSLWEKLCRSAILQGHAEINRLVPVNSLNRKALEIGINALRIQTISIMHQLMSMVSRHEIQHRIVKILAVELICYFEYRHNELKNIVRTEQEMMDRPGEEFGETFARKIEIYDGDIQLPVDPLYPNLRDMASIDCPVYKVPGTLWTKWFADQDEDFFHRKKRGVFDVMIPASARFLINGGFYEARRDDLTRLGFHGPQNDPVTQYHELSSASGERYPWQARAERFVGTTDTSQLAQAPFTRSQAEGRHKLPFYNGIITRLEGEEQNLANTHTYTLWRYGKFSW